ncbi:MAG: ArsA family ATPase [Actinobacteria bacterium]|nr:ArsA family ATPase [Actinomycetota bacterium]
MTATRVIVVTGAGGVGKSTFAAALAARSAASVGVRVLLITVDPARRLASAMGVVAQGNEVVTVADGGAPFSVSMLDTRLGWDALIRRVAPNASVADRVLSNGLYRNITGRFVNSHDYIAVERLWEVTRSGLYDLVIVDTPPSRSALSVIDAAERMREFFASRLLRWLTLPASNRLIAVTSRPFFAVADRVLGSRFLSDVSEFFALFRLMEPTFTTHAREVEELLRDESTRFLVVTTAEPAPAAEAEFLAGELVRRGLHLSEVVVNRMIDDGTKREAATLAGSVVSGDLAVAVDEILATVEREDALCRRIAERHGCRVQRVAEAQRPVNDVAAVRALAGNLMP